MGINRYTLLALTSLFTGLSAPLKAAESAEKPNIVVIMADDLGWNAVGYHNPDVKTPNLDRLCREGVELDNFYVSPMCSPTRAGFMTGRYPIRFGCARAVIPPYRDFGLPTDETTLADALAKAGYEHRGIFGKWHLGHLQKKWHPNNRGFTEFLGCYNGAIDYFTHEREGEPDWHHNDQYADQDGYITTLTGKAAADFIRKAGASGSPYFCYVPFNAPHAPFQAPKEYLRQYAHIENKNKQTYYAMITALDDEIGRILKSIEQTGQANNTLVWFFSDNGGVGKIKGNNTPLNGAKLTTYEGGVRTAACLRYPAEFPGGRKVTERTAFIDVFPTVLSLADISPDQTGCKPLDGQNLRPLLEGKTDQLAQRALYFYHGQQGEDNETISMIAQDWKLVVNGPNLTHGPDSRQVIELFKIATDPNETENMAKRHPEIVERLLAELTDFRRLQPEHAVPPYGEGRKGFTPPKEWKITD